MVSGNQALATAATTAAVNGVERGQAGANNARRLRVLILCTTLLASGLAIWGLTLLGNYALQTNQTHKLKVLPSWEKILGQKAWRQGSSVQSLTGIRYDPRRNLLVATLLHYFRDAEKRHGSEVVIEILDALTGTTLSTIVCENKYNYSRSLVVLGDQWPQGWFATTLEEENLVLLVNGLSLRTFDMTTGALQAALDLPQREAHWIAVALPGVRKVFLFDPVRKIKGVKNNLVEWELDFDLFEVQAGRNSIGLKKITSFRSIEYPSLARLYICTTCQREKLIWLQFEDGSEFFNVYDPIRNQFEDPPRKRPPHVARMMSNNPFLEELPTLWLDEHNSRWLHIRRESKSKESTRGYVQLEVWPHQGDKPLLSLRIPGVEDLLPKFSFDSSGTLAAVFEDNTTYLIDVNRSRIATKRVDKEEGLQLDAGLWWPDGSSVFRFLRGKNRVKVKAYKIVPADK